MGVTAKFLKVNFFNLLKKDLGTYIKKLLYIQLNI